MVVQSAVHSAVGRLSDFFPPSVVAFEVLLNIGKIQGLVENLHLVLCCYTLVTVFTHWT